MAKNSILDITIRLLKQGGADKEVIKGLTGVKSTVSQAMAAFAAFAAVAYTVDKALDATVGKYVEYATEVEKVKNLTGATAEESSRMIQMADDLEVSYESLTKAMQQAAKHGIEPNIEGLAQLADQYTALAPGAERTKFLMDNLGKSGNDMANILKLGGAGVREWAASIDDSLIITEQGIKDAQAYKLAMDNWNDAITGLGHQIGSALLPPLTTMINYVNASSQAEKQLLEQGIRPSSKGYEEQRQNLIATIKAEQQHQLELRNSSDAMVDTGESAEELNAKYKGLLDLTFDLQDGYDRFNEKQAELSAKQAQIKADFAAGNITLEERDAALQELSGQFDENAKAAEMWSKKLVFSMLQARLAASGGGIDSGEFAFLIGLGESMGLIDEKTAAMAQNVNSSLDSIDLSKPEQFYNLWQNLLDMPHIQNFKVTTVITTTGTGAGLGNCFVAGTMISMADGSLKPIEQVYPGERVISYDDKCDRLITAVVSDIFQHAPEEMGDHYLLINGRTGVTPNHLLYINNDWQPAGSLKPNDWLKDMSLGKGGVKVHTIQAIGKRVPTYNLHVAHESHNYFADGILAHNAKAGGGLATGPGDGTQDSFLAPLANGEFVVNAKAVREPGMLELLTAINSGKGFSGGGSNKNITIHNLNVYARGTVNDVLEELS